MSKPIEKFEKSEVTVIPLERDYANFLQRKVLNRKTALHEYNRDMVIETFTAKFSDGKEVDIKVCNGDGPYIDAVIFDPNGQEIYCLEPQWSLCGEYVFYVDKKRYTVMVDKKRSRRTR